MAAAMTKKHFSALIPQTFSFTFSPEVCEKLLTLYRNYINAK